MRILAVRGQNLASLAEPFEIDLTVEPLAGAGLFAITGETGAGKSTLLDAICLALYGDYPRLDAEDGANEDVPDGDGDALKARDARSILRRGATQGSCEVDFVAVDGVTYRAHWAVNRARGRAGGRLQQATRLISRLGPEGDVVETVAEKTQAVKERIVELTDFTFEQFRRTVLLAQGDFDAFLRADDRERADLLEKITGTEIYARLSAQAFERARAAREALAAVEARRREIGVLDPETRAARIARRAALAERLAALRAASEAARAALAVHGAIATAEARLTAAEAETVAADAARAGAEATAARLARIERAATLRPVHARCAEAREAEAQATAALAEVETRLADSTPRFETARRAREEAQGALERIEGRIVALAPEWAAAARLDTQLELARREAADAEAPWRAALAARDAEKRRIDEIDARRVVIATDLARIGHDLARLEPIAPLAERWEDIEARLGERIATAAEAARAATRRAAAEADLAAMAARLAGHEAEETRDRAARAEVEARIATRHAALAAVGETDLRARDAALAALHSDVARLAPQASARVTALDEIAAATASIAADRTEAETTAARRSALAAHAATARARRDGLAAAADLADAVASAEAGALRARLVEGEPCPVCGARDHPILADPRVAEAMARLKDERATVDAELADLDRRIAEADRAIAGAEARLAEAERRRTAGETRRAAAETALAGGLGGLATAASSLGLAVDPASAGADPVAALAMLAESATEARGTTAAALAQALRLREEIDGLRLGLDRLDADREIRRAARRDDEAAHAVARGEIAAASEGLATARTRLDGLDARILPLLAGLEIGLDDLDRDGAALVARLERGVAERRGRLEAQARAADEEKDLERRRHGLAEVLRKAGEDLTAAATTLEARREAVARLGAERAGLLGGLATADHRGAVETERAGAVAALDGTKQALDAARSAHETAITLQRERHAALIEAQEAVRARDLARDRALAAAELDEREAAELLALPEEAVAALREELAGLDARRARAHAAAAERRRDLAAALAGGRPEKDPPTLEAEIAAARAEGETLNREIGALDHELATDDAARATAVGLEREIAAAKARRDVLAAVDEAIGSRDGAKFRQFVQGITLDRLTDLANHHLASLNPRYRLRRADGLGLTIVDRDMGDEIRSTRSLSGGERFLASLALALALSGLEGRRTFVDTLFIDEGFGSLDAATLDVAIDALEGLQSEGRKVGVISHVAAMHDRIPVQIQVEKAGAGRSRVRVTSGA